MESPPDQASTTATAPLSDVGNELIFGIVEAAPDGIVMVDSDGVIVLVNRQTEELFGYDRGELLGKPVEQLLPERFRQVHRAHRTRYQADPHTRPMGANLALLGRRGDGTEFAVEISLSPLGAGSEKRAIAIVRDITERRNAEAETRRVRTMLDATKDGTFIFDGVTLRFSYVNDGALAQVGYSRDELLGMTPLHIAPEFTEGGLRALLGELEAGGSPRTLTTIHRRRDGTDVPVEVLLQAAAGMPGHPADFIAIVRDIRERLEAEQLLHAAEQSVQLLEDRERIARDLHDLVIQRLFAAGMALQATVARSNDRDVADRVARVVDDLDDTIHQLRSVIFGLQERRTAARSLRTEVLRVIANERPALGFEPHVRFDGPIDTLGGAVAVHLLPTLREALSNVARHAAASSVEVELSATAGSFTLRVVDNGIGGAGTAPPGNGVRNASARAASLGGTCVIGNGPEGGTVLEWRVPISP
ncbi:MAG: PAS domain-containing sensor histidine kinase [Polyangiales bacterium]